jgi:anti-sigma regulatory factor (Ser/Thr protein kinase)
MPRILDVRLPISVRAPGIARQEIRQFASSLDEEQREDVVLLVSELVSNSVRHAFHARDCIRLRAWAVETAVRVSVVDSGPGFAPALVVPEPDEEGHRGLWLVDLLADTWGISVDGQTSSWFEMRARPLSESWADSPGHPLDQFLDAIAEWPLASRELAWCMAASLGPPVDVVANRLTWMTPECVATILCPDQHPARNEPRHRGLVEDRNGRWWLETLRSHQHRSSAGNPDRIHAHRSSQGRRSTTSDTRTRRN